jgi:hypothetical protein
MRVSRVLIAISAVATALAFVAVLAVTGWGSGGGTARQVTITVPSKPAALAAVEPGKTLMQTYGYTPVSNWYDKDGKVTGAVYVACGDTVNTTECGRDLHNRGTMERPNVYVKDGKIFQLEGPHDSSGDDRSYYVRVPDTYQAFGNLTREQQDNLLSVMPTVAKAVGVSPDRTSRIIATYTVSTSVGNITAWASRF